VAAQAVLLQHVLAVSAQAGVVREHARIRQAVRSPGFEGGLQIRETGVFAALFFIIISAKAMAIALAYYGVPVMMKGFAAGLGSPYLLLLIIAAVYLLLGTVFEDFSLMIIMLPFVLPMIRASGFDQVWFGVFMTMLLQAGLLSPPVGLNLFVIQGVTGAALSEVVWGSLPFLLIMLGVGVVLVLFPPLAIWLPSYWIG